VLGRAAIKGLLTFCNLHNRYDAAECLTMYRIR